MFRYESFIEPTQLARLQKLSKTDWCIIRYDEQGFIFDVSETKIYQAGFSEQWWDTFQKNKFAIAGLYLVVESMRKGPKVIEPSFENCLALENTELKIPYKDYKQIFPITIVEIPAKYQEYIQKTYNFQCPKYIFCGYDPLIMMNFIYKDITIGDLTVTMTNKGFQYLEDHLKVPEGEVNDYMIVKLIERIVINLNLILTNYGYKSLGFHKLGGKKHLNETPYELIAPADQMIKMYEKKDYENKGGTHASPQPHWRRGHWRQQPTSKGYEQRFIKPIFVCAYKATGDSNQGIYIPR